MKRTVSTAVILSLAAQPLSARQIPYTGAYFLKTIEYNKREAIIRNTDGTPAHNIYNYGNKSRFELLLLGKSNSTVEFSAEPSFEGPRSLRLVEDNGNEGCRIEVRYISNYNRVQRDMQKKYQAETINLDSLTVEKRLAAEENIRPMPDRNQLREQEEFASYKL